MSWIREENLNIPPIIRCLSINPGAMKAVSDLNQAVHFGSYLRNRVEHFFHYDRSVFDGRIALARPR